MEFADQGDYLQVDNFIVQLLDKFTGMIGQRIHTSTSHPPQSVGPVPSSRSLPHRPAPALCVVGSKQLTARHIYTHGDQLIGAFIGAAVYTRNVISVPSPRRLTRGRVLSPPAHHVRYWEAAVLSPAIGRFMVYIIKVEPTGMRFINHICFSSGLTPPLPSSIQANTASGH